LFIKPLARDRFNNRIIELGILDVASQLDITNLNRNKSTNNN